MPVYPGAIQVILAEEAFHHCNIRLFHPEMMLNEQYDDELKILSCQFVVFLLLYINLPATNILDYQIFDTMQEFHPLKNFN